MNMSMQQYQLCSLLVLTLIGVSLAEQKVSYDNYNVIRALPKSEDEVELLKIFGRERPFVNFWREPSHPGLEVDIMVPPKYKDELEIFLNTNSIKSTLFISNVQDRINEECVGFGSGSDFGWDQYHTLDEIEAWLRNLADKYDQVELVIMGSTYEGRNLTGVHVSFSPNNTNNAVFVETNIHANEWITSATSTYILNELLTSADPERRQLAQTYDWYFLPVTNPDGFVYTHTVDRMWRKTRTPYGTCTGADPNRNWDNHWAEYGASSNPCSQNFQGPQVFSETNTRTLSNYLTTIGDKLVAYLDFHSFSQLLMVPYGYSPLPLDNYNLTYNIGLKAVESLSKRYGTKYAVGNIYNTIYPASGGSVDWVKATFKTPLVYVYELRDTGRYGMLLPPDQILPTGQETMDSVVTIFQEYERSKQN